jgi:hypothetical protein
MTVGHTQISCGIGQIANLYNGSVEDTVRGAWEDGYDEYDRYPIILFSDTVKLTAHHNLGEDAEDDNKLLPREVMDKSSSRGVRLARLIRKERLGKVRETTAVENPQTGNEIKCWMWEVDYDKLEKYAKKKGWAEELQQESRAFNGFNGFWFNRAA